ncbi:MAG: hypothetical protein ACPGQR_01050, partial [Marinirhabdus sp.]
MEPAHKYLLVFVLYAVVGCATFAPQYRNGPETDPYPHGKQIEKTFYLIGDAGNSPQGGMSIGLQTLQNYFKGKKTKGDYTVFLGDNIYPDGMPPANDPQR